MGLSDYDLKERVGEGAFGYVRRAIERESGDEVAVKVISIKFLQQHDKVNTVTREREILAIVDHPNIIQLRAAFRDGGNLYFVMEYASKGNFLEAVKKEGKLGEAAAKFYIAELISAVEHLHFQDIVHRDLKPENMLIGEDDHLRVIDFGASKILKSPEVALGNTFVGTPEYLSPELLSDRPALQAADLWAIGVITYQLLAGKPPFKADMHFQTFAKIQNRELSFPDDFPKEARDLVDRLLHLDPNSRIGSGPKGFKELKSHKWFKGIDFKKLTKMLPPPLNASVWNWDPKAASESPAFLAGLKKGGKRRSHSSKGRSASTSASGSGSGGASRARASSKTADLVTRVRKATNSAFARVMQHPEHEFDGQEALMSDGRYSFLDDGEEVVRAGMVRKRKGMSIKTRELVLTGKPRLVYIDRAANVIKGVVPWSSALTVDVKNESAFKVVTPDRGYFFECIKNDAQSWADSINTQLLAYRAANKGKGTNR